MESDYWVSYWKQFTKDLGEKDSQSHVHRTKNKRPIDPETWDFTVDFIKQQLELNDSDTVLDLCCGNGLIARRLAPQCKSVMAVDVSPELVDQIAHAGFSNISTQVEDIRECDFAPQSFSKIILYAGVQYLTFQETAFLFEEVARWIKDDGIFFVGDIPDMAKRWTFFDTPDREAVYFENLKEGKSIVGTWFEQSWIEKLARFSGFGETEVLPQHESMIYSHFRYDFKARKRQAC